MSQPPMDPEDTWGITAEFDKLVARLFAIANQQGVLLTVRIRRPRPKVAKKKR